MYIGLLLIFKSCKSEDPGFEVFKSIKTPLLVFLATSINGFNVSIPIHGLTVKASEAESKMIELQQVPYTIYIA